MTVTVEIRRASTRFTEREPGRATWHAFSFGAHYDPDNVGFGPMVCHDEHLLADGRGFDTHTHRDLTIVTWVVSGALRHEDSFGGAYTLRPGEVAILQAGSGVAHSEIAAAPQTRFVQVWLQPDERDVTPSYAVRPVGGDGLVEAVQATGSATLWVARLAAGQSVTLPEAPLRHVFVASGALLRSSLAEPLAAGDAFLIDGRADGGADDGYTLTAGVPTELLVWALSADDQTT